MKLSEKDAQHYFDLMHSLHCYVNKQLNIIPGLNAPGKYLDSSAEEKMEVRNALFADIKLIDSFVKTNPDNLSPGDIEIVSKWKDFIGGEFFIERFLKKYAVFIQDDDAFGVLGLYQSFDELIPRSRLPLRVETFLLPFKGKIIYDSLFQSYNIYFGGGIKRRLKEAYLRAKQNNRIIETLEPEQAQTQAQQPDLPVNSWQPELNALAKKAKALRGGTAYPALYTPSFSLVKTSIEFAQLVVSGSTDWDSHYQALRKVERALKKSAKVLDRQE